MIIGVPKEIKEGKKQSGYHSCWSVCPRPEKPCVLVEENADRGSGFADDEYIREGARMVYASKDIFSGADLVSD